MLDTHAKEFVDSSPAAAALTLAVGRTVIRTKKFSGNSDKKQDKQALLSSLGTFCELHGLSD